MLKSLGNQIVIFRLLLGCIYVVFVGLKFYILIFLSSLCPFDLVLLWNPAFTGDLREATQALENGQVG